MPPREYVTNRSLADPEKARVLAGAEALCTKVNRLHRSDPTAPDCWHSISAT